MKQALLKAENILFNKLKTKEEIMQAVKDMPLFRQSEKRRVQGIGEDLQNKLKMDIDSYCYFSSLSDESKDIVNVYKIQMFIKKCIPCIS